MTQPRDPSRTEASDSARELRTVPGFTAALPHQADARRAGSTPAVKQRARNRRAAEALLAGRDGRAVRGHRRSHRRRRGSCCPKGGS
eukprot:265837-Chlamydomonas_euryale.AAC.2